MTRRFGCRVGMGSWRETDVRRAGTEAEDEEDDLEVVALTVLEQVLAFALLAGMLIELGVNNGHWGMLIDQRTCQSPEFRKLSDGVDGTSLGGSSRRTPNRPISIPRRRSRRIHSSSAWGLSPSGARWRRSFCLRRRRGFGPSFSSLSCAPVRTDWMRRVLCVTGSTTRTTGASEKGDVEGQYCC